MQDPTRDTLWLILNCTHSVFDLARWRSISRLWRRVADEVLRVRLKLLGSRVVASLINFSLSWLWGALTRRVAGLCSRCTGPNPLFVPREDPSQALCLPCFGHTQSISLALEYEVLGSPALVFEAEELNAPAITIDWVRLTGKTGTIAVPLNITFEWFVVLMARSMKCSVPDAAADWITYRICKSDWSQLKNGVSLRGGKCFEPLKGQNVLVHRHMRMIEVPFIESLFCAGCNLVCLVAVTGHCS
jgi:hypothetical protein